MEIIARLHRSLPLLFLFAILLFVAMVHVHEAFAAPMKLLAAAEAAVQKDTVPELQCTITYQGEYIEVAIQNAGVEPIAINAIFLGLDTALNAEGALPNLNIANDTELSVHLDGNLPPLPVAAMQPPMILYQATMDNGCPKSKLHPGEELRIQFVVADPVMSATGIPAEKLIFGLQAAPGAEPQQSKATWYVADSEYRTATFLEPATLALLGLGIAGMVIRQGKRFTRSQ